jgi:AraC-like DNA-binding protein
MAEFVASAQVPQWGPGQLDRAGTSGESMGRRHRATRITSGSDGIGSWALHRATPPVGLQGLVARQVRWHATHADAAVTRELPSGEIQLIVAPLAPVDVRDPADHRQPGRRLHAFVAGLHEHHAVTANAGDSVGVQFGLTAAGAAEVLGVPPKELRGQVVDLGDLLGRDADRLVEAVGTATDPWEQIATVETVLLDRLPRRSRVAPQVRAAWATIERTRGTATVGQLAAMSGWSRRHFTSRFHDQLGMPPKLLASLVRFRTATPLIEDPAGDGFASIAVRCGYADQAHLTNEVRRFAGCTPAQLRAGRGLP